MSISQVDVNILGRQFTIGTPDEEAETLRQAVYLLNQKIGVIQDTGRIVETDKIVIMAALNLAHDFLQYQMPFVKFHLLFALNFVLYNQDEKH